MQYACKKITTTNLNVNCHDILKYIGKAVTIYLIQHFEAYFLWKVSLEILNSGIILNTSIHVNVGVSFDNQADKKTYKSFIPFTVEVWKSLLLSVKNADSLNL